MRVAAANEQPLGPYAETAALYWESGWRGILPLPTRAKKNPPTGYTGEHGAWPNWPDIQAWIEDHPAGNIALRLPDTVIGVDVDCYAGKTGAVDLAALETNWGPLPATWTSSSRSDGSSIRFYQTPAGITWPSDLGDSIEIIRYGHRYAVVWPSIHPEGRPYRWTTPDNVPTVVMPRPDDLTPLPAPWIAGLTNYRPETSGTGWTNPELDELVQHGIPANKRQDDILRDVAWQLRTHEVSREATRIIWQTIARKTPLTRPSEPWTDQDFDRHWNGANAKIPPPPTVLDADPDDPHAAVKAQFPTLNWVALWEDETEEEWLVEPVIAKRRLVALYSAPKVGKSLLMLELAVAISRGTPTMGTKVPEPTRVLYVDFENDPRGDIRDRLRDMGLKPDDLSNLSYLSYPSLSALDTAAGADQLLACVTAYGCELVIIDTVSRAVQGDENENDTWLNFYRHTGLKLKQAQIGCVRLDHSGKDELRGQRGGSAKSGDVDAVWRLTKVTDDTLRLLCEASRMVVHEKDLTLTRTAGPLGHHVHGNALAARLSAEEDEIYRLLLDQPIDAAYRELNKVLKRKRGKGKSDTWWTGEFGFLAKRATQMRVTTVFDASEKERST